MQILSIAALIPPNGGDARFEGIHHDASASLFVVHCEPGKGPPLHRHPYEEIFVILEGEVEVTVGDETRQLSGGTIVVVPAGAWHQFKNLGPGRAHMVNVHPAPQMSQENWSEP